MSPSLQALAEALKAELSTKPVSECARELCGIVSQALADEDFVNEHLPDRPKGALVREVLYEDPDLGFCICGHVNQDAAETGPHDHGSSWAIYGQVTGETEMTDWTEVEVGHGGSPTLVRPLRTYLLRPGDAHFYDVGDVHSPKRTAPTRLLRIEGANLDRVQRSNIKAT